MLGGHGDDFNNFNLDNNPDFELHWEVEYGLSGDLALCVCGLPTYDMRTLVLCAVV